MKPSTWEKSQSTALDPGERGSRWEGRREERRRKGGKGRGGGGNRSEEEEMGGEGGYSRGKGRG